MIHPPSVRLAVRLWALLLVLGSTCLSATDVTTSIDVTKASGVGAANATDAVPRYKPSARSPKPLDIRTNAYGATRSAPNALELGDTAPEFRLPTAQGDAFVLADARARGDVVVVFYRGHW